MIGDPGRENPYVSEVREGCHYNSNHPKQETQCHLVLHGQWSPDLPSQSNKLDLDLPSLLMITNRVSTTHHIPFTQNNIVNDLNIFKGSRNSVSRAEEVLSLLCNVSETGSVGDFL